MSTITREFTKEQLQQIIENDHVQCGEASALARIALASLEAEAVAWRYRHHNGLAPSNWRFVDNEGECNTAPNYQRQALYTAPPAPVSVPAELTREEYKRRFMEEDEFDDTFRGGWNACRATMLQGADGALTNEDTKRVGELVMWVKRLAHSLRKANPDSKLQIDAMDYLSRKGLIGVEDILR